MRTFILLDVVGITLFAWFCVVRIIPSCNVSMYRYRLWRLRDQVADDVREGVFQDATQPQRLVRFIEGIIVLAPELGAVKLAIMRWSCRHVPDAKYPFDLQALRPQDRKIMEARLNELGTLTARRILFGSPSGWCLTLVLTPLALISSLVAHLLSGAVDGGSVIEEARHRVRDEIEVDRALMLLGDRSTPNRSALLSA
jgi:hypothetical protein